MFHNIMSSDIKMHNMIIEDEFDIHGSIVNLNVIFILEVGIRVDKT